MKMILWPLFVVNTSSLEIQNLERSIHFSSILLITINPPLLTLPSPCLHKKSNLYALKFCLNYTLIMATTLISADPMNLMDIWMYILVISALKRLKISFSGFR